VDNVNEIPVMQGIPIAPLIYVLVNDVLNISTSSSVRSERRPFRLSLTRARACCDRDFSSFAFGFRAGGGIYLLLQLRVSLLHVCDQMAPHLFEAVSSAILATEVAPHRI
jgi:hypothetical protein